MRKAFVPKCSVLSSTLVGNVILAYDKRIQQVRVSYMTSNKKLYEINPDTLDPINLDNKAYNVVYTVRVRLIKYNRAQVAEKITSRYGGKGVVSKIVADEMMPIINGKRVEVILNPYSTINRRFCDIRLN